MSKAVMKGDDTKRSAPPHPSNFGESALRTGLKTLADHHAEKARPMPRKESK